MHSNQQQRILSEVQANVLIFSAFYEEFQQPPMFGQPKVLSANRLTSCPPVFQLLERLSSWRGKWDCQLQAMIDGHAVQLQISQQLGRRLGYQAPQLLFPAGVWLQLLRKPVVCSASILSAVILSTGCGTKLCASEAERRVSKNKGLGNFSRRIQLPVWCGEGFLVDFSLQQFQGPGLLRPWFHSN